MDEPVVVLTGAGVSTASGIPDFRSPGGVWERFNPMEFTLSRLLEDPDGFWQRRMRLIAAMDYLDATPNTVHRHLAQAVEEGLVSLLVTQNIDGLHRRAGTPEERLLEVHGNGALCRCLACHDTVPTPDVMARPLRGAPRCDCGGLLKPDVVLFGEPVRGLERAAAAAADAGTFIAAGTSLQVHPAAGLVALAHQANAQIVLLNRDPTPYDALGVRDPAPLEEAVPRWLPLQASVQ